MAVFASEQIIGRYTIYGKIASGGMASVHFGRLLGGAGFSRTVAVKRLHPHLAEDPEFMATMVDEARLVARIHHPNVVPTLDVVAADGELLLVMEYVRGESLGRLIKIERARGGRVSLPVASAIALGALHGLHAAHVATSDQGEPLGIVHRDVSPQNILVGVDGLARVIDFGVAKAAGRLQTTQEGVVKGKLAYMAPEQLAVGEVTRRADVYAMGVVLWELLAGRRLFQADNDVELLQLVLAGASVPPSRHAHGVPRGLDDLVMTALAFDPARRFATAYEMAENLLRVVPPAFPTDVGAWCEHAAREPLAQRWALLAEIESRSGVGPVVSGMGENRAEATHPSVAAAEPSSLSLETPRPNLAPRSGSSHTALAAMLGGCGGLLIVGLAVVWATTRGGSSSPASTLARALPTAHTTATVLTSPAAAAQAEAPSSTAANPSPEPAVARDEPASRGPQAPGATLAVASSASSTPVAPKAPKVSCTPPYEYDRDGNKTWKRQCL